MGEHSRPPQLRSAGEGGQQARVRPAVCLGEDGGGARVLELPAPVAVGTQSREGTRGLRTPLGNTGQKQAADC